MRLFEITQQTLTPRHTDYLEIRGVEVPVKTNPTHIETKGFFNRYHMLRGIAWPNGDLQIWPADKALHFDIYDGDEQHYRVELDQSDRVSFRVDSAYFQNEDDIETYIEEHERALSGHAGLQRALRNYEIYVDSY